MLLAAVLTLLRLPVAVGLELCPDESYYWLWSRRLDLSYFDHPPMVAWLIRLSTSVFGDTEWAVRVPALVCGFVIAVALADAARRLAPEPVRERAALLTALLASVMPLAHVGAFVVTPDSPAAAGWAVALAGLAAVRRGRPAGWYVAGLGLGFGLLSKYTAVLLGASVALVALLDRDWRREFRTPHPWLAGLLATAMFGPVLVWNAQRDWVSFLFQLKRGVGGTGGVRHFLEFVGAQLAILTPMGAWILVDHVRRGGNAVDRAGDRLLTAVVLPTIALFTLLSFNTKQQANWAAFAYLGTTVIGGLAAVRGERLPRVLYTVTVVSGAVMSLALSVHALKPLVRIKDDRLVAEFSGWRRRTREAMDAAGPRGALLGDNYRTGAWLAYYSRDPDRVDVARTDRDRRSQFDVWPPVVIPVGGDAAYVSNKRRDLPPEWRARFASAEPIPLPDGRKGTLVRLRSRLPEPPAAPR